MYIDVFFKVEKKQGAKKRKKECALLIPIRPKNYYIDITLKISLKVAKWLQPLNRLELA